MLLQLERGLVEAAQSIVDAARAIVPVKTGRLQNSIRWQMEKPLTALVQAGGEAAPYAGYVENGTSRMAAQPFMSPAVQLRLSQITAVFERGVAEEAAV